MPRKGLPAIVDGTVWEEVTKGQVGIRCDSLVEKIWKDMRGNTDGILPIDEYGAYNSKRHDGNKREKTIRWKGGKE